MKTINKFNQYLLEKYPSIWNTKLVWMLLSAFLIHLIFYVAGYVSHSDPKSLQHTNALYDYFDDGVIFIHIIISLLMLVVWLVMMFKNNAFKNHYPTSIWKLFLQYFYYFLIIFSCISFYFSYMVGYRALIYNKYDEVSISKDIETINRAYPFLSQNVNLYTVNNRAYPDVFRKLYCETSRDNIVGDVYMTNRDQYYQYYNLKSKVLYGVKYKNDYLFPELSESFLDFLYSEDMENHRTYYYKNEVVDMSSYFKSTDPSFYNFSSVFYTKNTEPRDFFGMVGRSAKNFRMNHAYEPNEKPENENTRINKLTTELLNKENSKEIEKLLSEFLIVSNKYKIRNNLDASTWTKMVYHPENNFIINKFIMTYLPERGEKYNENAFPGSDNYATVAVDAAAASAVETYPSEDVDNYSNVNNRDPEYYLDSYFYKNITPLYYYSEDLKVLLDNVENIKTTDFITENVHVYLWITFLLAGFLFCYRMTSMKSMIFTVVSSCILVLVITLVSFFARYSDIFEFNYFVGYFVLAIGLIILLIPLLLMKKMGRMPLSIFMNISFLGFVLWVLLIFLLISFYQRDNCRTISPANVYDCPDIIEDLGFKFSFLLLGIGVVFNIIYTKVFMNWKAKSD